MKDPTTQNIRLGLFVIIGTIFIITAFYLIGSKQNIFGSTFRISAKFHNVNGLMVGNNVRFAGINVGTVESIEVISDSSVNVVMVLEEKIRKYINKKAVASIGTDGLMGNKLVNINSGNKTSPSVAEGDVITTINPIETDDMLRTLNTTNDNIKTITNDLKNITHRINSSNSLWSLLMDTTLSMNIKQAAVNIRLTSDRAAVITGDLSAISHDLKAGKSGFGALLTDTSLSHNIEQTIVGVKLVSDQIGIITGDLHLISDKIKSGQGAVGTLLMDTTFVSNLNKSIVNIKEGSIGFNENMEALKHSIFLRGYFKKLEKENKKSAK